ncbi:hypothetical protein SKAU_G00282420 [Synaphobranchus kaupii]|uniref:SCAN box domain-containing protein n=1 Tax=Synaphobranchus kaupii TaxID=118154 RepID=A0A9Q1INT6_SYNKA|nr:hypothetical protein SKAU_G00282420 [Synaphobranchus kaupii]
MLKFDISPETYRQRFRERTTPPGEIPTETYHRLRGLYRQWIRLEQHTKEEIGAARPVEEDLGGTIFDTVRERDCAVCVQMKNLQKAQQAQKKWYDQYARKREY